MDIRIEGRKYERALCGMASGRTDVDLRKWKPGGVDLKMNITFSLKANRLGRVTSGPVNRCLNLGRAGPDYIRWQPDAFDNEDVHPHVTVEIRYRRIFYPGYVRQSGMVGNVFERG